MLYPEETTGIVEEGGEQVSRKKLIFKCRSCFAFEDVDKAIAEENCVYAMKNFADSSLKIDKEISQDPTLTRTNQKKCPECDHGECVFFQNTFGGNDTKMELIYVCANEDCGYNWKHEDPNVSEEEDN